MTRSRLLVVLAVTGMALSSAPPRVVSAVIQVQPVAKPWAENFAMDTFAATKLFSEHHIKPVSQADAIRWAVTGMYQAMKEPIPKEISKRLAKLDKAHENEMVSLLFDARAHLGQPKQLQSPGDLEITLQAIFDKLEPGFKHPAQNAFPPLALGGVPVVFVGVGLTLQADSKTGFLKVITPILDSPAHKAGILHGDFVTKIIRVVGDDGIPLPQPEEFLTKGMSPENADKKIFGRAGTKILLIVAHAGKERQVAINRGIIQVETVVGNKRNKDNSWNFYLDPKSRFVYLRLSQFSTKTYSNLEKALQGLSKAGINGLVLDLRFNPGGPLDSAVETSDLFIDDGMIVTIKKRSDPSTSYVGASEGSYLNFPMVCLVNGESASGSEIVAACLQDHNRAVILGARTKGKGEVRTLNDFGGGRLVNLMTASFSRPNGKNLSKFVAGGEDTWGVQPNAGLALPLSAKENQELLGYLENKLILRHADDPHKEIVFHDRQLELAEKYLREMTKNQPKPK